LGYLPTYKPPLDDINPAQSASCPTSDPIRLPQTRIVVPAGPVNTNLERPVARFRNDRITFHAMCGTFRAIRILLSGAIKWDFFYLEVVQYTVFAFVFIVIYLE
jgi:hypothetical protein